MQINVKYHNVWYHLFEQAKYPGKSIITGKRWPAGTAIYWNMDLKNGFTVEEYSSNKPDTKTKEMYHSGPVNTEWTYDDSRSRKLAAQIFEKYYNIKLIDNQGLYTLNKENGYVFKEVTPGIYCEDLVGFTKSDEIYFVEVERTKQDNYFDQKNSDPINILVSKYWKYFHDGNTKNKHFMCFINEELMKACVITGTDIKFNRGAYKTINIDGKIKEFYEVPKQFAKIYDLDKSVESLIDSCTVDYIPM